MSPGADAAPRPVRRAALSPRRTGPPAAPPVDLAFRLSL